MQLIFYDITLQIQWFQYLFLGFQVEELAIFSTQHVCVFRGIVRIKGNSFTEYIQPFGIYNIEVVCFL